MPNAFEMYDENEANNSQNLPTGRPLNDGVGLAKVKIDMAVFRILLRKRRAGETVRMALERAITTL